MTDYIERGGIMTRIAAEALKWGEDYDADQILGDIEDFPAADVRPVVRGEWIHTTHSIGGRDEDCVECPICGEYFVLDEWAMDDFRNLFRYCPNCGTEFVTNRNQLEEDSG